MDSDDDYYGDSDDAMDEMDFSICKTPSFQTLTAVEIVKLMNEEIGHVDAIFEVSRHLFTANSMLTVNVYCITHNIVYKR